MLSRRKRVDYMTAAAIVIIIKGISRRPLRSIAATTTSHRFCLSIAATFRRAPINQRSSLSALRCLGRLPGRFQSGLQFVIHFPVFLRISTRGWPILFCCSSLRSIILAFPYDPLASSFALTSNNSPSTFVSLSVRTFFGGNNTILFENIWNVVTFLRRYRRVIPTLRPRHSRVTCRPGQELLHWTCRFIKHDLRGGFLHDLTCDFANSECCLAPVCVCVCVQSGLNFRKSVRNSVVV